MTQTLRHLLVAGRFDLLLFVILALQMCVVGAQLSDDDNGGNVAEVRQLLNEIKIAAIKKYGIFSDVDPTLVRARQSIGQPRFDDGTEHSANKDVAEDLFENDIVLTVPQANAILDEVKSATRSSRRGGASQLSKRQAAPALNSFWPSPVDIPYIFQYSDQKWQAVIRQAQQHIASETCVRFTQANYNALPRDYVQFIRGSGCWSSVGRVGYRQQVSIGYGCDGVGIVAHEILHALGLWHEQSRNDRDAYITINFNNISPGTQSNFEKRSTKNSDNMGQPYDLGSVMHYGSRAFSTAYNLYTLITRDSAYQQTIGQREKISFKDGKMINLRYCTQVCSNTLNCKYGGYINPNNCSICKCPDGYGGTLCEEVLESNVETCRGGEYTAYSNTYEIKSPQVTANTNCYYRIKAGDNQKIEISFTQLNFPCSETCSSYVEIKYKNDKISTGARLCCDKPATIVSEGPEVMLIFRGAEDARQSDKSYAGFQLKYKTVDRSVTMGTMPVTSELTTETSVTSGKNESTQTTMTGAVTTESPRKNGTGEWSQWAEWGVCTMSCGGCGLRKRVRACYGGDDRCSGSASETESCGEDTCPISKRTTRCRGRLLMPCDLIQKLDFGTVLRENTIFNDNASKLSTTTIASLLEKTTKQASESIVRKQRDVKEGKTGIQFIDFIDDNQLLNEDGAEKKTDIVHHLLDTEKNAKILQEFAKQETKSLSTLARYRRFVDASKQLDPRMYCEKQFSYNCPTHLLTISMDWRTVKETQSRDERRCCPGYYASGNKCLKNS